MAPPSPSSLNNADGDIDNDNDNSMKTMHFLLIAFRKPLFEMGIYPDDMKIAKVIALFKKGKTFDPNNYRPISLLSHFDNFFEKILCKRLISFLEINKIYYCHQFGFRKGYSTAMALTEIIDCIKHLLDENNYVVGIFIDFKKAFDTVDHNILLSKLDHYGIRGHANMFLGLT